ncbi:MAG: hypothetical protein WA987_01815 [Cellvibrio sp.]
MMHLARLYSRSQPLKAHKTPVKSGQRATAFYKEIKNTAVNSNTTGGGVIDLVLGDTNQSSALSTPRIISTGMDGKFQDGEIKH